MAKDPRTPRVQRHSSPLCCPTPGLPLSNCAPPEGSSDTSMRSEARQLKTNPPRKQKNAVLDEMDKRPASPSSGGRLESPALCAGRGNLEVVPPLHVDGINLGWCRRRTCGVESRPNPELERLVTAALDIFQSNSTTPAHVSSRWPCQC